MDGGPDEAEEGGPEAWKGVQNKNKCVKHSRYSEVHHMHAQRKMKA